MPIKERISKYLTTFKRNHSISNSYLQKNSKNYNRHNTNYFKHPKNKFKSLIISVKHKINTILTLNANKLKIIPQTKLLFKLRQKTKGRKKYYFTRQLITKTLSNHSTDKYQPINVKALSNTFPLIIISIK